MSIYSFSPGHKIEQSGTNNMSDLKSFDISLNTAVVTSTYVIYEHMPVLFVSHEYDEDGDIWQFHCGNEDYDMSKMLLVSLGDVLTVDASLVEIANLPKNFVARRNYVGDKWICSPE
jgi:hypothetical protein